ncbi:MAG: CRTAC1 family protein [Planctomycetota bacterium]|nr:CRTAC1 family protein [Planctomycetota bacterium]
MGRPSLARLRSRLFIGVALAMVLVGWRYVFRPAAPADIRPATSTPAVKPAAAPDSTAASCPIQLCDVTNETGITFVHTDGSSGRRFIVEQMSTGLATFDYDGDGLIDIYFPNGAPLPGAKFEHSPHHALYRNLGGGRFQDVTNAADVACTGYGLGIAIGDYDNDGFPDIYLNHFGPNVLYRNNGDGTFTDVTSAAGVARGDLVGAGVCFLDVDADGTLDLYVGNYITLDVQHHVPHLMNGFASYPSPLEYTPVPDTLYRNNGDDSFTDISQEAGIAAYAGRSMGMISADYDNDGAVDVFVCNDVQENFLFHNDGHGHFQQVANQVGVALNHNGEMLANMGVDAGDYNHDGLLDFYTTNYQNQLPMLLKNLGHGLLENVAPTTNAGAAGFAYVNWGCGFVDFDNDGHPDLFLANGHTEDNIEQRDRNSAYRTWNVVLKNTGAGRFVDVSAPCGIRRTAVHSARGVAFEDLDNDGDIDVVVLNSRERPTVLRNMLQESGSPNHWLQIRLRGVTANRDGVGARVRVVAGDLVQIDEVHSGRGYQSHWGSRLHFGLGPHDRVDRIEVRWLGGGTDLIENVRGDRLITIIQGSSPRS